MTKKNEISRRDAFGLAAGAAVTLASSERWVFAVSGDDVVKTPAAGDAAWRPALLSDREGEALARMVDVLIPRTGTPGARDARVHEYIDLAVSVALPEEKKSFVGQSWSRGKLPPRLFHLLRETAYPETKDGSARRVYSVGEDRTDDGGNLKAEGKAVGSDLGYMLYNVDQRRLPAQPPARRSLEEQRQPVTDLNRAK